jgi:hypothetical protein
VPGYKLMAIVALTFQLSSLSFAKEMDCYPSKMGKDKTNFPDSVSIESVCKATGIKSDICGVSVKKWPYKKATFIVYAEDTANYYVYIISAKANRFSVDAKYEKKHAGDYRFSSFDFAPYKITKNSTALGFRFTANGPYAGGGYTCEKLLLLENNNNKLREILFTTMAYEALIAGEWNDDGSRDHSEVNQSGIIMIGNPDGSGYNKLIKKVDDKKEIYSWENDRYSAEDGLFEGCSME